MFTLSSCVAQRHLSTKGWKAVAAASQTYCAGSSNRTRSALFNSIALRNFGGKCPPATLLLLPEMYVFADSYFWLILVIQDVPSMGDSITEGVVESYVKSK